MRHCRAIVVAWITLVLLAIVVPQAARAGFVLGDAANFAVLYEGNGGNTLNFNNSTITGNIGIGGTGKMAVSGPGTITGNIEFYAASSSQFSGGGVTITGTYHLRQREREYRHHWYQWPQRTLSGFEHRDWNRGDDH